MAALIKGYTEQWNPTSSACMVMLLIILLCLVTTNQETFTSTPTSVNATLGSTAIFNCSVSKGALGWLVGGSTLPELNVKNITFVTAGDTSTLSIPATDEYNNTNVICSVAGRTVGYLESEAVVLRVQGLLGAVGSLKAYSEETFILLTWTPPFSLDLTGIDPDLWYCVEVYNISSGGTLLTNSYTVSEPRFNFTVTSPSPCDLFEFRVTPVNGAGNGSMTSINGTFFGEPEFANATVLVNVLSKTEMYVEILFTHLLGICNARLLVPTKQTTEAVLFPELEGSGLSVNVINDTDGILFNDRYNITLELMNNAGKVDISKHLSLFDVQESTSNNCSWPETVNASCTFAQNSQALGCLVVLHPHNTSQIEMFAYAARNNSDLASRENSSVPIANIFIHGVPEGNYTVVIFDGEENGLLSTQAATAVQHVTIMEGGSERHLMDSAANASIREDGDRICVNCSDVDDGESKGCVVVVHSNQTLESAMSYKIPLFTEKCFPQEGGEYTVAVFRQNMSNVLRQVPVNVSVVSIRVPTLTPTTSSPIPSITSPTTPVDVLPGDTTAATVAIVLVILIAAPVSGVIVIIIVFIVRKKKRNSKKQDFGENCDSNTASKQLAVQFNNADSDRL